MKQPFSRSTAVSLLLCSVGLATWLRAGPLNPPAGPVASSYKTLSEVEPRTAINSTNTPGDADSLYRITQPGSYYLTGNITGVAGKHGIEIAADDVTIDLAGFELLGVAGSLDGISDPGGVDILSIRNGSIRNWGDEGIDCVTSEYPTVSGVSVQNCAGIGISVGRYAKVSHCNSASNGGGGITTAFQCIVSNCTVSLNAVGGIATSTGCRVVDCAASNNAGNGISTDIGSSVSGCAASDGVRGISVAQGCTVQNSSAYRNSQGGIFATDGATITQCSASTNTGVGITVGDGCNVSSCTARSNTTHGISAAAGAVISDCSVSANAQDGILVGYRCLVTRNQCGGAFAAGPGTNTTGIHVTGIDNRIEANLLTNRARGLDVDMGGNLIFRNIANNNTVDWDIAAVNFGQFVVALNSGAAFAGNAGGAALGSTDPWVNFSY